MLSAGVALGNRYLLTERIAAGGMGEVWHGTDRLLKRQVAVKVLLPSLSDDSEFISRFRTEARMMAALKHPGIVQIYDYGEDVAANGSHLDYLVMEYVDGTPLSERIEAAGRLGVAETTSIVAQAAAALQVAHDAGIVHRDVKPSNLLVRPDGAVVLVDFGVARSSGISGVTSTNVVLGSAHFMAPEQAEGKPVSPATDTYALGAVAYCCLAGRPPFVGEHPLSVLAQLVQDDPAPLPADVPAAVSAMVLRCLQKWPGDRYASAAALANAARAAQGAVAAPARSAAPAGPGPAVPSGSARYLAGRSGAFRPAPTAPVPAPLPAPPTAYVPMPPPPVERSAGFPPARPAAAGRRNNTTLTVVAVAAIVAGIIGVVLSLAFHAPPSEAQTNKPPKDRPVGDVGLGAGQRSTGGTRATGTPTAAAPTRVKTPAGQATATGTATAPTGAVSADPSASASSGGGTAVNPINPRQVCGNTFQVIDSAPLRGPDGVQAGKVFLLFSSVTGKNCTVTLKSEQVGVASPASAFLEVQGATRVTDSGAFQFFAGPVRAAAAGVCVKWGGSVGDATFDSPFEHCG